VRAVLMVCLAALALGLAGCGKRGSPSPPGPANEVTYPKVYPTR
jgi:predicted small lipoprotein YifL